MKRKRNRVRAPARRGRARRFRRLVVRQAARLRLPGWMRSLLAGVLLLAAFIAIPTGIVFAIRDLYFVRNPRFAIRALNVDAGDSLTRDTIREWLAVQGVHEGRGLFAVDMYRLQQNFAHEASYVKTLRFERRLPDTLNIRVVERQPVARIRRSGNLVVDEEGLVFVRRVGLETLPVLTGGRASMRGSTLVVGGEAVSFFPASRIQGMGMAAIEFIRLNADADPAHQLPVNEVDVAHTDYILLRLMDRRQIKMAWDGMGTGSRSSLNRLQRRWDAVHRTLQDPAARKHRMFDATVDDRHIYGQ